MQVTTINANGHTNVKITTARAVAYIHVNPGETPAQALQRNAADARQKAARLMAQAARYEVAADVLLTPAN